MPRFCILLALAAGVVVPAAQVERPQPVPLEPIGAIVDAFRTHDVVAVTEPHDNEQVQALLLALIRDPRFSAVANDIVIETASARYQDAIDRFVRGDDVPRDVLRRAWEDHTVANSLGVQAEEMIRAVRASNASPGARSLRVIAGDPPIDWAFVATPEEHRRWIELRDSYPADLIRRQVLDRGRRALVIYGQAHLQRRQIVSNYDMSTWQAQTVVSLLERDAHARVFNIWTLVDQNVRLPDGIDSWRVPSLAMMRGTTIGAGDFETYSGGFGFGSRFGVRDGRLVPLPRDAWTSLPLEEQFDALLYLGPPSAMTQVGVPPALCADAPFMSERLQRLARFAPPAETDRLRAACR
jgi:hypothetical protein